MVGFFYYGIDMKCARSVHFTLLEAVTQRCSAKIILRNFAKFTGETPALESLF